MAVPLLEERYLQGGLLAFSAQTSTPWRHVRGGSGAPRGGARILLLSGWPNYTQLRGCHFLQSPNLTPTPNNVMGLGKRGGSPAPRGDGEGVLRRRE